MRIATAAEGATYHQVGGALAYAWQRDDLGKVDIQAEPGLGSIVNCVRVLDGSAELAICQNDTRIDLVQQMAGNELDAGDLRTLIPLYPEICFIVYKDSLAPQTLKELIVGRRVGIGPRTSGTSKFMKRLFMEYGIDSTEYTPVYNSFADNRLSDTLDISCSLTGFNNPKIPEMLRNGGQLFSLDSIEFLNRGSSVEGFCMNYPRARPYVIPRRTYGYLPDMPISTVAVDAVLVGHQDLDPFLVYDLLESLFRNKPLLEGINPLTGALSEQFSLSTLNFPLHEGTENYLDRSEPTFLEQYAEAMSFLLAALLVSISGLNTLARWNRQRKKDRVDDYYNQVLRIEEQVERLDNTDACRQSMEAIHQLKREAFDLLIAERLNADESFRIFIQLANDTLHLLQERKRNILSLSAEADRTAHDES